MYDIFLCKKIRGSKVKNELTILITGIIIRLIISIIKMKRGMRHEANYQ